MHIDVGNTVKARNNALGGNVTKHPKTGRYLGPGRYFGPLDEFFSTGISTVCFTPHYMCTYIHTIQDVPSCEYTQLPRAFTRTQATTRIKRVDMLCVGAYTEGGRYCGLLQ